jgi:3-deoxy-7-phosphoheptulonate synthase
MHGNTYRTAAGFKTRAVEQIMAEITGFFAALRAVGGWPGGIHLESTPQNVTECVGGRGGPNEAALARGYRSVCDPRLNGEQTAQVVEHVARLCRSR